MGTSDVIALGLLLVTALSVVAALLANARANSNQKEAERLSRENNRLLQENNKLNERLVVLEEERREEERGASLSAWLNISKGDSYDARRNLTIENVGPGIAYNVEVEPGRFEVFDNPFPKPRLAKGERETLTYRYGFMTPFQRGENIIRVTWKHPSGEVDKREVSIP